MADPYVGEIRAIAFPYAPNGWLLCNGQIVSINAYQALYALLSNTFGGNVSQGTFGLPDLQGRSIIGVGTGAGLPATVYGAKMGQASLTLATNQMPLHTHSAIVNDPGHTHTAALPAHTHSFAVPCDSSTAAPTLTSPVGHYLSNTAGLDANINAVNNNASTANINTGTGSSFPPVNGAALYSASGAGAMGAGTTGAATASGASTTGVSTTGVSAVLGSAGGTAPVSTQTPALGLYYMIATMGIYPSRP